MRIFEFRLGCAEILKTTRQLSMDGLCLYWAHAKFVEVRYMFEEPDRFPVSATSDTTKCLIRIPTQGILHEFPSELTTNPSETFGMIWIPLGKIPVSHWIPVQEEPKRARMIVELVGLESQILASTEATIDYTDPTEWRP